MLQFVNIFSWNKSTKQGWWGGAHKCPSGIFMHKDNRPLTFLRQGWQGWDCCSENRNEQSRRGEWRPVAALSCCASSQPSLCCALSWEASGSRIPWSVSAAAPDQELQWHNPSSFLLHELTSSSQLWMDRNLLLSSCESPQISQCSTVPLPHLLSVLSPILPVCERLSSALLFLLRIWEPELFLEVIPAGIPWGCALGITSEQEDKVKAFQI